MIPIADSFLLALGKGLEIWDFYNKTRYARRYKEIYTELSEEHAKPVYAPEGKEYHYSLLRDQAKIDKLQLELKILIDQFLKEKPTNDDKTT